MVNAAPEFFDSYAEPHRRRPSAVEFPAASYLLSLWHPRRFQQTFAPYMETVLRFFVGKKPLWTQEAFTAEAAQALSQRLFSIYDFVKPQRRDERLVFDFEDDAYKGLAWRLEVHREFITVVAFISLNLSTEGGDLRIEALTPRAMPAQSDFSARISLLHPPGKRGDPVTDHLFDGKSAPTGLETHAAALLQRLLLGIDGFCDGFKLDGDEEFTDALRPAYFAKFFGCIMPWTVFAGHDDGPNSRPWFPDLNALGRRSDEAKGQAETSRFMDRIWPDLCGDFLNFDRSDDPEASAGGNEAEQSCVACYLQNGHAFYVSSLGARRDDMDRSALHYMVLYQDHPDWHGVHGPTSRRSSDGELGISGRLSRLTGRLHDIGVARLAAMKQVDQLKNFAQYLSHVENQLQRYNPERPRQGSLEPLSFEAIQELRSQTFFRAEAFDESVVNRSLRASGYFESVRTLSEDLGIIGIPRWQSYELFIRRRLFRTLHEISAVSARYQAVLKVFNTIYQMQTAEETKRLARRIGASTQGARDLMDQLRGLQFDAGIVAFLLLFATAAEVLGRYTSARLFGLDLTGAKAAAPMVALAAVVAAIGFTLWTTVKKAFGKDQGQEDRT